MFVILFSVLLGGVLTTAFGAGKFIGMRRENKQLKHKINHLEKTIEQQTEIAINEPNELLEEGPDEEGNDGKVD